MYFLGNGSNRIITEKAFFDIFTELGTGDTVEAKYLVHGSAKAWANLNGTGTIALRDSLNVSSVVDNGVGDYSFNLSTAMLTGYAAMGHITMNSNITTIVTWSPRVVDVSTSQARVLCGPQGSTTGSATDNEFVRYLAHGDLA